MEKKMKLSTILLVSTIAFAGFSLPTIAASSNNSTPAKVLIKQQQKVNLNTAGASELAEALTGVGMKKAAAIINYRKAHGNFKSIAQLIEVKGIGEKTLAKNKGRMVL